jgi:hypothetical protein
LIAAIAYFLFVVIITSGTTLCAASEAACVQQFTLDMYGSIALLVLGEVAIFLFFFLLSRAKAAKEVENVSNRPSPRGV